MPGIFYVIEYPTTLTILVNKMGTGSQTCWGRLHRGLCPVLQPTMHMPGFSTWTHFSLAQPEVATTARLLHPACKSHHQPWIAGSKQPSSSSHSWAFFFPHSRPAFFAKREELSTSAHHCQLHKKNYYLAFLQDERPVQWCLKPYTVEQRSIENNNILCFSKFLL